MISVLQKFEMYRIGASFRICLLHVFLSYYICNDFCQIVSVMIDNPFTSYKSKYFILSIVIVCIYVLNLYNNFKQSVNESVVTLRINTVRKYESLNYEKLLDKREINAKSIELIDLYIEETYREYNESKPKSKLLYPNYLINGTQILMNNDSCSEQFGEDLLLLVFVFNRVDSFERRKTIRNTWGYDLKTNPKSKIYFTVAKTSNQTVQKMLEEESRLYSDIIQINYYEFYYNCTMKALGLLRWASLYCPFVKWILKVDDDSVLISNEIIEFAETTNADCIYGRLRVNSPAMRGANDKWLISSEDYPNNTYPDYMAGAYLIPGQTCLHLYRTALTQELPALPYEDAYITGIVAERVNIARKNYPHFIWFPERRQQLQSCWLVNATLYDDKMTDTDISHVWQLYQNRTFC